MLRARNLFAALLVGSGAVALVGIAMGAPPPSTVPTINVRPVNPIPTLSPPSIRLDAGVKLPLKDAGTKPPASVSDAGVKPVPDAGVKPPVVDAGAPAPALAVAVLSPEQKALFLQKANGLRASLGAPSMQTLAWDENLASSALELASRCELTNRPSSERMNVPGWVGMYLGELVAGGTGGTLADATNPVKVSANLEAGLNSWWAEKNDYDYAANTCAPGKVCGHYTQLAWAETRAVGCAVVMCAPYKTFNTKGYSAVCDFGPGGNMAGKRPY
jgi:pathogenesis-related protein 1